MKNSKILQLLLLLTIMVFMSSGLEASIIGISPGNGSVSYCPVGQTSTNVLFRYSAYPRWPDPPSGGFWALLFIDGNCVAMTWDPPIITIPAYIYPELSYSASLGIGTHSAEVMLVTINQGITADVQITFTVAPSYSIIVSNSYGGNIIVDGTTYSSSASFTWGQGTQHTLQALYDPTYMDQNDYTYTMNFINWSTPSGIMSSNPMSVTAVSSGTYRANIEGVCISGPGSLAFKKAAVYAAHIAGGSGSYTYQWYRQSGSTWSAVGSASTQNFTMINSDIPIRVDVHDNISGASLSAYRTIYYDSGELYKGAIAQETKPTSYTITNNPNPFNPSTVIHYQLPLKSNVKLSVYDMLGREVATVADGIKEAGYYTATFNASRLTSGIYFARFTAVPEDGSTPVTQTTKMLLAK